MSVTCIPGADAPGSPPSTDPRPPVFLEPERTRFDLPFAVAGFPVRIHPFFWLVAGLFGLNFARNLEGVMPMWLAILLWTAVMLVSITIHELGHGLAFRRFGMRSRIVLYGMGGLCIPEREVYREVSRAEFPWNSIFVSFAGPLAGFIFAGLIIGLVFTIGMVKGIAAPVTFALDPGALIDIDINPRVIDNLGGMMGYIVIRMLLQWNIYWGLINLLPIYPLDGGQIARSLFQVYDAREPVRHSLVLSMVAAVVAGMWAAWFKEYWMIFMFLSLGFVNYQELRVMSSAKEDYE